jgi:serine/threonine protein kinase
MSDNTRIGATVGGYRIESLIGRGGMSVVYLAEHVRLGRQVALKLLAPSLSADAQYRERFSFESRRAAEIDHPNVVPIFDAGEADGQLYIAMRYIVGCDLKTLIRREGSLGVARTLFLLEQTADALDAAHERNLIHRDVKPANILIAEAADRAYLTDFGVVKHTGSQSLTKTGLVLGTIDYAAPEQIEGLAVDARTDVYALGCVLYECLVGQAPFERDGELAVMHAHLVQPPPRLSASLPSLPRGLDAVIATAMAKAKDDRYETCGDLVAATRRAILERRSPVSVVLPALPVAVIPQPTGAPADVRPVETETARPPEIGTPGAPPPPPDPPAAPAERGGRRFASLPLLLVIAVLAAGASGLATYLATRGSGSSRPPSTLPTSLPASVPATPPATAGAAASATTPTTATTSTTATASAKSTTGAAAFTGPAATLVAMFRDPTIANTCTKSPHPGGQATLNCTSTTPGGKPVELHVDLFGSPRIVLKNYSNDALGPYKAAGGTLGSGTCTGTTWSGEGPWARGRRACFVVKGAAEGCKGLGAAECSIVYWYDAPSRVAVRATVAGARAQSAPQLAAWWGAHKADFGA